MTAAFEMGLQALQVLAGGWGLCGAIVAALLAADHLKGGRAAPWVWLLLVSAGPVTLLAAARLFFSYRDQGA